MYRRYARYPIHARLDVGLISGGAARRQVTVFRHKEPLLQKMGSFLAVGVSESEGGREAGWPAGWLGGAPGLREGRGDLACLATTKRLSHMQILVDSIDRVEEGNVCFPLSDTSHFAAVYVQQRRHWRLSALFRVHIIVQL